MHRWRARRWRRRAPCAARSCCTPRTRRPHAARAGQRLRARLARTQHAAAQAQPHHAAMLRVIRATLRASSTGQRYPSEDTLRAGCPDLPHSASCHNSSTYRRRFRTALRPRRHKHTRPRRIRTSRGTSATRASTLATCSTSNACGVCGQHVRELRRRSAARARVRLPAAAWQPSGLERSKPSPHACTARKAARSPRLHSSLAAGQDRPTQRTRPWHAAHRRLRALHRIHMRHRS
eukprot:3845052-Pleurochrysis_carterae.AAC.3